MCVPDVCVRACMCACMHACMHACMLACMHEEEMGDRGA